MDLDLCLHSCSSDVAAHSFSSLCSFGIRCVDADWSLFYLPQHFTDDIARYFTLKRLEVSFDRAGNMWEYLFHSLGPSLTIPQGGNVCVWAWKHCRWVEIFVSGTERKYCYTCCCSRLALKKKLNVAHSPHNILKIHMEMQTNISTLDNSGVSTFILIPFIVHICLKAFNGNGSGEADVFALHMSHHWRPMAMC